MDEPKDPIDGIQCAPHDLQSIVPKAIGRFGSSAQGSAMLRSFPGIDSALSENPQEVQSADAEAKRQASMQTEKQENDKPESVGGPSAYGDRAAIMEELRKLDEARARLLQELSQKSCP